MSMPSKIHELGWLSSDFPQQQLYRFLSPRAGRRPGEINRGEIDREINRGEINRGKQTFSSQLLLRLQANCHLTLVHLPTHA